MNPSRVKHSPHHFDIQLTVLCLSFFLVFLPVRTYADTISVAVASNALEAVKLINEEFQKQTGNKVRISSGSTGKLYAQIVNGAPFDLFLAANVSEPERLEKKQLIVPGSRFTYALGKLQFCSLQHDTTLSIRQVLQHPSVRRIAMANPKTAPYGLAAQQTMQAWSIWKEYSGKVVRGENISQAYQYYVSGNTQAAFLASSQLSGLEAKMANCIEVDTQYYQPIKQQAVILKRAQNSQEVKNYVAFIRSTKIRDLLVNQFGYGVEK